MLTNFTNSFECINHFLEWFISTIWQLKTSFMINGIKFVFCRFKLPAYFFSLVICLALQDDKLKSKIQWETISLHLSDFNKRFLVLETIQKSLLTYFMHLSSVEAFQIMNSSLPFHFPRCYWTFNRLIQLSQYKNYGTLSWFH